MILWLLLAAIAVAVWGLLLLPLWRFGALRGDNSSAHDLEVYRDQLAEIEGDRERGLISGEEFAAARLEIERRILRLPAAATPAASTDRSRLGLALLIAVIPIAGLVTYVDLGSPWLAGGGSAPPAPQETQVDKLIGQLEDALAKHPGDAKGWALLGRVRSDQGRFMEAVDAFQRAAALAPKDADAEFGLGEALFLSTNGQVTPAAKRAFEAALAVDPKHPGARFYLALARFQAGDARGAYDAWLALAHDSPPDAPWLGDVQQRLNDAAAKLHMTAANVLPSVGPGPSQDQIAAAQGMSASDRNAMIRTMVERLAARLAQNPDDLEGWKRLGRSWMVLGEPAKAADAYSHAAALAPNDQGIAKALADARAEAGKAN